MLELEYEKEVWKEKKRRSENGKCDIVEGLWVLVKARDLRVRKE